MAVEKVSPIMTSIPRTTAVALSICGRKLPKRISYTRGVDISSTKFHDSIDNSPYNVVQPPENKLYVGWTEPGEWFNLTV